ncbi:MAG TPA: PEGA domain-containing protein [Kofleriaceae bacterium]|nr:PEGA domain-containing protein [Kofleriaceae bacterium]
MSRAGRTLALELLALSVVALVGVTRARADDPPAEPPAPAPAAKAPDDGFIGRRQVTLAIDDCPLVPDLSSDDRESTAHDHYERGNVLYLQGDYEGAAREFIAGYCLIPVASLLKDIGQTYERMFQYEQAIAYFERYVLTTDAAAVADRQNMSTRVDVLRRLRARVTVATEPPGSTIELSDDSGRQALGADGEPLQVLAGTYEMRVSRAGYEPHVSTITVAIGQPYAFSFRLEPKKARLRIQTVPGDARIFVDGRLAGLGSYDAPAPLGNHDVMVEAAGRVSKQLTVELVEGENRPVAVELASLPGSGRAHLIAGSVAFGGVIGAGTGGIGGSGSSGAGFVLGALAGGAGGYLFVPHDVSLGTGSFLVTTGLAGAIEGLAIGGALDDADDVFANEDDAKGAGYGMVGGAIIGVGTGLVLAPRLAITPGDAALFNSGVGWGAITGALFIPVFDASSRIRYATLVSGLDLGVVAGALLATRYDVSRRRVVFIDLAGLAGMVAGLATESAVAGATNDTGSGERSAHYALGGMAVGLGLGTFLTRNLDAPKLPQLTPSVSRGADGHALVFSLGGEL